MSAALWLAAGFVLAGATAARDLLQSPSGVRGWWVEEAGDEVCVRDRQSESASCMPRSLGQLTDLRETASGWIAAGHRPARLGLELFVVRDRGAGLEVVAPPPATGFSRGRPALVTDDTRLLGLVWLEGATQATLEVRCAEWLGNGWSEVVTVSPVGPGSQVAPALTVLDDGRWLAVWTGFDGEDDETQWSVYQRGRWSAPARVHEDNSTPDIVPALVTTRKGAIAAWSWLDGSDYRLRTAFFDGATWRLDAPSGGRGGLEPRFVATAGTYLLSFQTVVPEEWVVYELNDEGRVLHRAAIAGLANDRPRADTDAGGAVFRWGGETSSRQVEVPWEDAPWEDAVQTSPHVVSGEMER